MLPYCFLETLKTVTAVLNKSFPFLSIVIVFKLYAQVSQKLHLLATLLSQAFWDLKCLILK